MLSKFSRASCEFFSSSFGHVCKKREGDRKEREGEKGKNEGNRFMFRALLPSLSPLFLSLPLSLRLIPFLASSLSLSSFLQFFVVVPPFLSPPFSSEREYLETFVSLSPLWRGKRRDGRMRCARARRGGGRGNNRRQLAWLIECSGNKRRRTTELREQGKGLHLN